MRYYRDKQILSGGYNWEIYESPFYKRSTFKQKHQISERTSEKVRRLTIRQSTNKKPRLSKGRASIGFRGTWRIRTAVHGFADR